jgi:hypothetical protein
MSDVTALDPFFERSLAPGERAVAVSELAGRGSDALPVLAALFNGEARNQWGVSYDRLGAPMDCGLVVAARLGHLAKPLEHHLRAHLHQGHIYAAAALGALGSLDNSSINALAAALEQSVLIATEAAQALVRCGAEEHTAVKEAVARSPQAAQAIERAKRLARARS